MSLTKVFVAGCFFSMQAPAIRFLEEAARLGKAHVVLRRDDPDEALPRGAVKMPVEERLDTLANNRNVLQVPGRR